VLLADEEKSALVELGDVLERLGHEVAPYAVSVREAAEIISTEDPDLSIILVHEDDAHALALIGEAVAFASGPVLARPRRGDVDFVVRAAEQGVSAWIDSLSPESIQGAIEVAMRRHEEAATLRQRVSQLETALERRAEIERAKGILMERHRVDERGAFELLRDQARARSTPLVEVAMAVNGSHALLPRTRPGEAAGPADGASA
jgi:response regulator NasT